jgi:hypothetical protein
MSGVFNDPRALESQKLERAASAARRSARRTAEKRALHEYVVSIWGTVLMTNFEFEDLRINRRVRPGIRMKIRWWSDYRRPSKAPVTELVEFVHIGFLRSPSLGTRAAGALEAI